MNAQPANAAATDVGTEVGTFSAVKNGGKIDWPSTRLVFDVTNAARKFGGQELTVELIPHRIGSDADQKFAPLKYQQMQIITKRP